MLPFSLLYLDLDDFKGVNDRYGHACGDELLKHVSARLRGLLRYSDLLARFGGDEFVLLLKGFQAPKLRLWQSATGQRSRRDCKVVLGYGES